VELPWDDLARQSWKLADRLNGQRFERGGDELPVRACTSRVHLGVAPSGILGDALAGIRELTAVIQSARPLRRRVCVIARRR
jgi:hypothetical protein